MSTPSETQPVARLKKLAERARNRYEFYQREHKKYRRYALLWRIAIGFLGAAGIVLLGLNVPSPYETPLKNVALVTNALVTFLAMLETYRDDRANYVRMAVTFKAFRRLELEIEDALAGAPTEADAAQLAKELLEIQRAHDLDWEAHRRSQEQPQDQDQPGTRAGAGASG